jgi:hypothetical protein
MGKSENKTGKQPHVTNTTNICLALSNRPQFFCATGLVCVGEGCAEGVIERTLSALPALQYEFVPGNVVGGQVVLLVG